MNRDSGGYTNQNNRITVNWVLSPGTAPLSLAPQSIVVTPVPQPRQIGATRPSSPSLQPTAVRPGWCFPVFR